jgi:hypothetical protein
MFELWLFLLLTRQFSFAKTESLFLVLNNLNHTDKYNIQAVDKTVKCAGLSELAAISADLNN